MDRSVQFTFLTVFLLCGIVLGFKAFQSPPKPPVSIDGPSKGITDSELNFNITNLASDEKDIEWSFGESGNIDSRLPNPVYKYSKPGSYKITLNIKDRPPVSMKIRIDSPPVARIAIDGPSEETVKKELTFNALNLSPGDTNLEWSFGETGLIDSRIANPKYTYKKAGSYTISLRIPNRPEAKLTIKINDAAKTFAPVAAGCPGFSKSDIQDLFQQFLGASNDDRKAEIKKQLQSYFANPKDESVISDSHYKSTYSFNSWIRMAEYDNIRTIKIINLEKSPSSCLSSIQIESYK